jgi:hypothetical protein
MAASPLTRAGNSAFHRREPIKLLGSARHPEAKSQARLYPVARLMSIEALSEQKDHSEISFCISKNLWGNYF